MTKKEKYFSQTHAGDKNNIKLCLKENFTILNTNYSSGFVYFQLF